jgi:hypothetical protein
MKKRSLCYRSLSLLGLLLLSLTIFVVSCKKQFTNESQINLSSLKNWQTKNFDHSSLLFNTLYPNWDKLFVNDQGSQNVYEIEVINKEKIFLSLGFVDANSADSIASKSKIKMLLFEDKESGKITDGYYMVSEDDPHYKQYNSFTMFLIKSICATGNRKAAIYNHFSFA